MWGTTENGTGNAVKASSRGTAGTSCLCRDAYLFHLSFRIVSRTRRFDRYANGYAISELIDRPRERTFNFFKFHFVSRLSIENLLHLPNRSTVFTVCKGERFFLSLHLPSSIRSLPSYSTFAYIISIRTIFTRR